MVNSQEIINLLNSRINRVLRMAQAALPEHQFEAYRKLVLDEFGNGGFYKDLERLFRENHFKERTGQE